jgi:hypothetical protein
MNKTLIIVVVCLATILNVSCDNPVKSKKNVEFAKMLTGAVKIQASLKIEEYPRGENLAIISLDRWIFIQSDEFKYRSKLKHPVANNLGSKIDVFYYYINSDGELFYKSDNELVFVATGVISELDNTQPNQSPQKTPDKKQQ